MVSRSSIFCVEPNSAHVGLILQGQVNHYTNVKQQLEIFILFCLVFDTQTPDCGQSEVTTNYRCSTTYMCYLLALMPYYEYALVQRSVEA